MKQNQALIRLYTEMIFNDGVGSSAPVDTLIVRYSSVADRAITAATSKFSCLRDVKRFRVWLERTEMTFCHWFLEGRPT